MGFVTKVDLSYNRQIKERPRTTTILSGTTQLGIPFSALTSGPDFSSEIITSSAATITSTFTGTTASTVYSWFHPQMVLGEAVLSALTPTNSGVTQNTDSIFSASTTTMIDGNLVVLTYSGVSFDSTPVNFVELAPNLFSGSVITQALYNLSAGTLDYTGRTIWSDNPEISRTDRLIVSRNPQIGYVLTCIDNEGMTAWFPSSGGTTGATGFDVFVTGGTCSGLDMIFTNTTGGTFTVTGCTSSGGTGFWSAGTGTGTIVLNGSNSPERSGLYSIVGGYQNSNYGDFNLVTGAANTIRGDAGIVAGTNNEMVSSYGFITGANNLLSSGATASAIIGGSGISANTAFTAYVPNLNINYTPDTGTTEDILVRASDGTVKTIENKFSKGLYSQINDANIISATTTETLLTNGGVGTQTIPANAFNVGDVFHLKLGGYVSSANNELLTIRFRLDSVTGTTLATIGAITLPTLTNQFWEVESDFVIRSLGGVGVAEIVTNGQLVYIQNSGNVYNGFGFNTKNNTTFDTAKSNMIYITAEWGSSNVSNAIQTDVYYITKVY